MRGVLSFAVVGVLLAPVQLLAQSGGACLLSGTAIIQSGVVDEDPTPESGVFAFKGTLSGPAGECEGLEVCSVGSLENATCSANTHSGSGKICDSCSLQCGTAPCDGSNVQNATIVCNGEVMDSDFQGVCVGAACVGGTGNVPGILYALLFNQATIENALAVCDDPTTPPDDSLTEAGFDGALAHGGP